MTLELGICHLVRRRRSSPGLRVIESFAFSGEESGEAAKEEIVMVESAGPSL